ncbi:MAG: DUF4282 domain-containing protein [Parvibaculum sp.]|uniref:DUF4282 domain-containing protein n=1 Tax=Parvibaculum sp. TaxID=2024848 RepID=UPI002C6B028D|nr:DUF4282 domain-containing protein [Parvibaculum sp.]HMM13978.1 DUF4282 domain-containing protein [Parvibaculum sp.]
MNWQAFLSFDRMIATSVVKFLYWIGIALIGLGGLIAFIGSFSTMGYSFGMGLGQLVMAVLGTVIAIVLWRVVCELYIVIFSMHDRLGEIRDRLPPRS